MKQRYIKRFLLPVLIYILFFMEIISIYASTNVCTFERTIKELKVIPEYLASGDYLYEIENSFIDEEDLYRLVNISGYLMKKEDDKNLPVAADLLLMSDDKTYKLDLYTNKRTDIYYLNQSDIDDKNLYVGWFGKFPAESVENGTYRIGLIFSEQGRDCVLWTDKMINIVSNEIKSQKSISDFLNYIGGQSDYVVCIAVKDEASQSLTAEIVQDFCNMGLEFDLPGKYRWSYLAVIDNGQVIYENLSDKGIKYETIIADSQISLLSAGYDLGNNCSIKINGVEYAINSRGINIVVYDKKAGYILDSICVDTFADSSLTR